MTEFYKEDDMREDELKNFPNLRNVGNRMPYEAPAGYFDSLNSRIQDRISARKKVRPAYYFFAQPVIKYALPLVIVFFVAGIVWYNMDLHPSGILNSGLAHAELTTNDVVESGMLMAMDESLLFEALEETSSAYPLSEEISATEEYILENSDVTDLIDQF